MTIESDLVALIGPIFEARFYPDAFPQSPATPTWPSARYSVVSGVVTGDICGSGSEETDDVRIQIDVVSLTSKERNTLTRSVRAALLTFSPPAVLDSPRQNRYDSETKTFISTQDFIFYGSSS